MEIARIIKTQANKILLQTIKIQIIIIIIICLEIKIIVKTKTSSLTIWLQTYLVITIMRTNNKINYLIMLIQIIWTIKTNRIIIYLVNQLEVTICWEWQIRINWIVKTIIWTIWTTVECSAIVVWIKTINNNNRQITPS